MSAKNIKPEDWVTAEEIQKMSRALEMTEGPMFEEAGAMRDLKNRFTSVLMIFNTAMAAFLVSLALSENGKTLITFMAARWFMVSALIAGIQLFISYWSLSRGVAYVDESRKRMEKMLKTRKLEPRVNDTKLKVLQGINTTMFAIATCATLFGIIFLLIFGERLINH